MNDMKKGWMLTVMLAVSAMALAQNTTKLDQAVKEAQRSSALKSASLSVTVYNITNNASVYRYDSQRSMVPASMNKLFTTAVGFDRLGSTFRFKTTLKYVGRLDNNGVLHGDVVIVGGGDPILGSYRYRQTTPDTLFATWAAALRKAGIKGVDGRICYDATIFDNKILHDTWQWGDVGNYYGSGVCGLNFHENMFFAYFTPGKKVGYPADLDRIEPKGLKLNTQNNVNTGAEGTGDNVIIYGDPSSMVRVFDGTVPMGKSNFQVRGAMPHPAENCAALFADYLRKHGVPVSSSVTLEHTRHSYGKEIIDYYSNTYYVIAQYTNLTSNNTYAECILKYLGYKAYGKGSYENGVKAVEAYCKEKGLTMDGVKFSDGSGLSRQNRVTGDFVCRFLKQVASQNIYGDFSKSLAKVGESGTAKNMLPKLPANVAMKVKSGTMDGVKTYAGYVTTAKGELLCFSVMANNFTCPTSQVKPQLEKILMQIGTL